MALKAQYLKKRLWDLEDYFLEEVGKIENSVTKRFIKQRSFKKKKLSFPKDIYPLENTAMEWWYFSGHLNNRFGYEFCIFKIDPRSMRAGFLPLSLFRKKPFLITHFALSDKREKKFYSVQESGMFGRQEIGNESLNLKTKSFSLKLQNKVFYLKGKTRFAEFNFQTKPLKKPILHFSQGFNEMIKGQKTYYLSLTRLKTEGTMKFDSGNSLTIKGLSWFDHQKMNRLLQPKIEGWDWFSIIFNDGCELMLYNLMTGKKNKKRESFFTTNNGECFIYDKDKLKKGTFVDKNSNKINLDEKDIIITVLKQWKSPRTKITYPSGWKICIPKLDLEITVNPYFPEQELSDYSVTPVSYWEGACYVKGKKKNRKIKGEAYVELVGYDQRFLIKLMQKMI